MVKLLLAYIYILLLLLVIITSIIYYVVFPILLKRKYKKAAKLSLPNVKIGEPFLYKGRVVSIETCDKSYERFNLFTRKKIKNLVIYKAFIMLENRTYLHRSFNRRLLPNTLLSIYNKLNTFANLPENKGRCIVHNKISDALFVPATYLIHTEKKLNFYLATL